MIARAHSTDERPASVSWPGGAAMLRRAEALSDWPLSTGGGSFVALFAAHDPQRRWEAAPSAKRTLLAGPGPARAPAGLRASTELLVVSLAPAFLLDAAGQPWHPNHSFRRLCDGGDDVAWLMGAALRQECRDGGIHGPDYAGRLASVLAVRLAERHLSLDAVGPLQGGLTGHRLRACLEHIDNNLHRDVAIAELAGIAGLSTPHFARAFRRSLGEPPHRYFRRRRIERARSLLVATDQSIAQIALECGYAAQSHFTSAFKMLTMTTPAAFRRGQRDAQAPGSTV